MSLTLPSTSTYITTNVNKPIKSSTSKLKSTPSHSNPTSKSKTIINRWGHTSIYYNNNIYLYGGFGKINNSSDTRLSNISVINIDNDKETVLNIDYKPPSRVRHTAVIYKNLMIVYGGRSNPENAMKDLWIFNIDTQEWKLIENNDRWPESRFRHSAIMMDKYMYIYGGKNGKNSLNDLWRFDVENLIWEHLGTSGDIPSVRHSQSLSLIRNELYLFGGICEDNNVLDPFIYILNLSSLVWRKIVSNSYVPTRYSHCSVSFKDNYIIVIGGCDTKYVEDGVMIYNTLTNEWKLLKTLYNLMLCKFSVAFANDILWIVGGGAHCFSFGMYFFGIQKVSISDDLELTLLNTASSVELLQLNEEILAPDHIEESGDHLCSACNKGFISRNKLFQHIKTHKKSE